LPNSGAALLLEEEEGVVAVDVVGVAGVGPWINLRRRLGGRGWGFFLKRCCWKKTTKMKTRTVAQEGTAAAGL
jgi:hypothetical protein